ncbi:chemotaxis response regulator protein-glutamate methylesterase [Candidatus Omnitrophota bacterium]
MANKIRVLIVDDSFLMRKIISDIVSSDANFEVVGKAKDGKDALDKVFTLNPDVVTLDINLPVIDGLEVLKEVIQKQPTRVIMISAHTQKGASATMLALELGAVDFISKPSGEISLDIRKLKSEIISKIRMAAQIDLGKLLSTLTRPTVSKPDLRQKLPQIKKLVVIGASTGGPKAILKVLENVSIDVPAAFLIVQHMPEGFTLSFAERISWQSKIKAKEAEQGDIISSGKVYVAPAGSHMVIKRLSPRDGNLLVVELNRNAPVNYVRPSIDVTMQSAAEAFCPNVVGVILTGMGKDGLEGAKTIKQKGGVIIAQDEDTSVVWGMPKMVANEGLADIILPLHKISAAIIQNIER